MWKNVFRLSVRIIGSLFLALWCYASGLFFVRGLLTDVYQLRQTWVVGGGASLALGIAAWYLLWRSTKPKPKK